ncbi:MAG: MBL fold metallo-hydrolase [Planctomycetota bacterium]|nr:MBL fold metallo-hydrolase [Planctomycetota bacterium]
MPHMTRQTANIILYRQDKGLEVFLVSRSSELRFLGGYLAFAGGKTESGDETLPLDEDVDAGQRTLLGCAVRELFEETGILALRNSPLSKKDTATLRQELLQGGTAAGFFSTLAELGASLPPDTLQQALQLVTPGFSRERYASTFFLMETREEPEILPGELAGGSWYSPTGALAEWERGELLLAPPVIVILRQLSEGLTPAALESLQSSPQKFEGSGLAIPWGPGIEILPFHCPPLPPSLPSSTFLVGARRFLVLDPSPSGEEEQRHLLKAIENRIAAGDQPEAIVLSHHHIDHVGALEAVLERWDLPCWGHRRTGELLKRNFERELADNDTIELGDSPDGTAGWQLRCLFTPGHAEGHLAFYDPRHKALLACDLLSTLVSMYVGTPGGHLETYFQSLEKIRALDTRLLYPSHGMPTLEGEALIDKTIKHRRSRIEQVQEVLSQEPGHVLEISRKVYDHEKDSRLRPLYERTTRAALEYLVENGRARRPEEDLYEAC